MTPFVVAEIGANHLGSLSRARQILSAAAIAGADAVKLQCWTPGTMAVCDWSIPPPGPNEKPSPWSGMNLARLYEQCFTPWKWFDTLFSDARELGLELFASAFDKQAVDFLESFHVKRHKIASAELVDLALINYAAATRKPLILSTGMASCAEIEDAVNAASAAPEVTLLRCVSGYPSSPSEAGLALLLDMPERWPLCGVGLSDHTLTDTTALLAVALGATVIEKHFTLSRVDGGPDAAFSLEPTEFMAMVNKIHIAAEACDHLTTFGPQPSEQAHVALRRSLYWSRDLEAGHIISDEDMITARPALGLAPRLKKSLIGQRLPAAVSAHSPVSY